MKNKLHRKTKHTAMLLTGLLLSIVLAAYSLTQYYKSGAQRGVAMCVGEECFVTLHIHAEVEVDLCGHRQNLPRETGPLQGLHTHKEKNLLHFHDRAQESDARLTLEHIEKTFSLPGEKFCPVNAPISTSYLVNGSEPKEGSKYMWKDGDQILIQYTHSAP